MRPVIKKYISLRLVIKVRSYSLHSNMYIKTITNVIALLLVFLLWNESLCVQVSIFSFLLTCKIFVEAAENKAQIVAEYEKRLKNCGIM